MKHLHPANRPTQAGLSRRGILKILASVISIGKISTALGKPIQTPVSKEKLGLNMGSVAQALVDKPMQTIGLIDQLGIRNLELQNISLLQKLHPVLKGAGFNIPSSFFPSPYITGNWNPMTAMGMKLPTQRDFPYVVDQAVAYSLSYLVMPGIFPQDRGGLDDYKQLADKLNVAGELCSEAGVQCCYHHYAYELQPMENTSPLEVMLEQCDARLVKLQVNTFWLSLARIDIPTFLKAYAAYLGPLHLEDISDNAPQTYRAITLPPGTHQPPGQGMINFSEIFSSSPAERIPYYFIHLEDMDDPLAALRTSVAYLEEWFN